MHVGVLMDSEQQRWLQEKYTEIAALAGGLAHEIKNPLSTVGLNLQLLAEDLQNPETQRERRALAKIEVLQRECKRLENIVNDFLRYARVTDLQLQPTDIVHLINELVEFVTEQARSANVLIRTDLPSLGRAILDRDLFRQALQNLVLNAIHAMPNGGELIIRMRDDQGWLVIDVIDTGMGMSEETLSRIFKPFFSTRKDGTGLGLSMSRKIIESMGGQLTVESQLNRGSAFSLRISPNKRIP